MKRHIPNILTCMNLICGSCAVIMSLWGYFYPAFCFILASAAFDFLDGFAARLLGAYSNIGKELDSLADLVRFSLAPSPLFFSWYYKLNVSHPSILSFIPLLIVVFSAVRLAKFNIDEKQKNSFIGLPTPSNAMIIGSLVSFGHICAINKIPTVVITLLNSSWFIPVASIILSLLLVSSIPMSSLKHGIKITIANISIVVVTVAAIILEILLRPNIPAMGIISIAILAFFCTYLLTGLIFHQQTADSSIS